MTPTQAENLRILIRYMDACPKERLDMSQLSDCGTPACAMGHARTIKALGLQGQDIAEDARVVFGLPCYTASSLLPSWGRLFGSMLLIRSSGQPMRGLINPTPQEWATEARFILSEYGYSMDDGFAAFKAKILTPIPETQGLPLERGAPIWD